MSDEAFGTYADCVHEMVQDMTTEQLRDAILDRDKEIRRLRETIRGFDPEIVAYKVTRLCLDDADAIAHQLATVNWDVALLLKFEDLPDARH